MSALSEYRDILLARLLGVDGGAAAGSVAVSQTPNPEQVAPSGTGVTSVDTGAPARDELLFGVTQNQIMGVAFAIVALAVGVTLLRKI